jgi:arylsulfatase A-like enzyme
MKLARLSTFIYLTFASCIHGLLSNTATGATEQPNVLFLSIDDLNDWIGGLGGHPQAKTPNLDRLISQSVLFENAHCAAPVCSASRHALLSGLRPSSTGWYSNSSKDRQDYEKTLGETIPMPTHFKRNGYKTMAAGKVFHKGTSDVQGYEYWDEERPSRGSQRASEPGQ